VLADKGSIFGIASSLNGRTPVPSSAGLGNGVRQIDPFILSLGYVDNDSWELQFTLAMTRNTAETGDVGLLRHSGSQGNTSPGMNMDKSLGNCLAAVFCSVLCCFSAVSHAQEGSALSDASAQANNPLANFTALNFHDYYIGELTDTDENANQVWARFAKPFTVGETNWIMRASLPLNTYPVAPQLNHETGIGDMNLFAAYLIDTGNPTLAFGIGPQITAPTASKDALGSEKWSAGLVNTLFNFASPVFQYGYLLSWQTSFAGADDRDDVNVGGSSHFSSTNWVAGPTCVHRQS
jgi:hypothetical protein